MNRKQILAPLTVGALAVAGLNLLPEGPAEATFCSTIKTGRTWTVQCSDPGHLIEVNTEGRCRYYDTRYADVYRNGVGTGARENGTCPGGSKVITIAIKVIRRS